MRFFILVVPALFLMVYTSCRNDNDIIAEMKLRNITRAEFHQWLSGRDINPEEIYNNNGQSEMLLQQMAVEILSVEKAVSDNFDTTPFYDNINRMVFANLLSTYYKSEIKNNLNYNEPAVEVKLLKLYFPQDHNNRQDQDIYSDKIALAGHIIQQYKSGISFDDLNRKYSEDKYSYNAGKSNVIPELLLEKELADKIKNLKDGDSISEPAVFNDHVLIVNIIRRMFITKNNAERLINNNDLYDQFMEKMSEGIIEYIIAENGVHLNIVSNIEKASFKQNNELLFSVDGESFTSGQLKELLNLFNFLKFKNLVLPLSRILKKIWLLIFLMSKYSLVWLKERESMMKKDSGRGGNLSEKVRLQVRISITLSWLIRSMINSMRKRSITHLVNRNPVIVN
jgi:hypothetical protein